MLCMHVHVYVRVCEEREVDIIADYISTNKASTDSFILCMYVCIRSIEMEHAGHFLSITSFPAHHLYHYFSEGLVCVHFSSEIA